MESIQLIQSELFLKKCMLDICVTKGFSQELK